MPIYQICSRCGTKYLVGTDCPNHCKQKNKKETNKLYDKYQRKNRDVYHSRQWDKLREYCINKYSGICIYTLYKYGKIVPATLVHHIIEVEQDRTLVYEMSNLMPLSDEAHREIHKRYNNEDIKEVQKELRQYLKDFEEEHL